MSKGSKPHVVILGAGISGLSLAYFLKKKYEGNIRISVLEKEERVGGWISTSVEGGFLVEGGPRTYRSEEVLKLAHELHLDEELLFPSKCAKKRYLFMGGKLRRIPMGVFFGGILHSFFAKKDPDYEETVKEYSTRRFGKKFTETLMDPLALGVYGGSIDTLSMKAAFPTIFGRKKMQKSAIFSFKKGMQTLPDALASVLKEEVRLGCEVVCSVGTEVHLASGEVICADYLYSTLPDARIPHVSLQVTSLCFRKKVLPVEGFGYLVPTKEHSKILGVIFDSSIFPGQNRYSEETRLTVMSREKIDVLPFLPIHETPDIIVTRQASIPQYVVGHQEKVREIEKTMPPRCEVLGNSFYGVSLGDCVARAKFVAEKSSFIL